MASSFRPGQFVNGKQRLHLQRQQGVRPGPAVPLGTGPTVPSHLACRRCSCPGSQCHRTRAARRHSSLRAIDIITWRPYDSTVQQLGPQAKQPASTARAAPRRAQQVVAHAPTRAVCVLRQRPAPAVEKALVHQWGMRCASQQPTCCAGRSVAADGAACRVHLVTAWQGPPTPSPAVQCAPAGSPQHLRPLPRRAQAWLSPMAIEETAPAAGAPTHAPTSRRRATAATPSRRGGGHCIVSQPPDLLPPSGCPILPRGT